MSSITAILDVGFGDRKRPTSQNFSYSITLQFGPAAITQEIDTWKDVYGIEERYKAKLCGDCDGKYWLMQVLDECSAYNKQSNEILAMRALQADTRPYADCNFLRKPFLDACQQIGLL